MAVVGRLQLHGTVVARAYVHRRSPAAAVGTAIKADLIATLRTRMEALRDEAELLQVRHLFETYVSLSLCVVIVDPSPASTARVTYCRPQGPAPAATVPVDDPMQLPCA